MQSLINQVVNNFFQENLAFENRTAQSEDLAFMHVSKISLSDSSKDEFFYVMVHDKLANDIAFAMLFEENPDDETIVDLVNETANLIIGNLKVALYEEYGVDNMKLSTPEYLGYFEYNLNKKFINSYGFMVNNHPFIIGQMTKVLVA